MTDVAQKQAAPTRRSWRDDLPVAAVAAGAATLLWLLARLAGVDLEVHSGGSTQHVGVLATVITPVAATLAAGALLRGWERRSFRARRRWTGLALGVLALSLLGPVSALSLSAGLVLAAMHLLVGAVIVVGLTRTGR